MDLIVNAVTAGARLIYICLTACERTGLLMLDVCDNGKGMHFDETRRATDPFWSRRSSRRFGFGLALLAQSTQSTGGHVQVQSRYGKGTRVRAQYSLHHVNRPPFGDIAGTLFLAAVCSNDCHFIVQVVRDPGRSACLDTRIVRSRAELRSRLMEMFPSDIADFCDAEMLEMLRKGDTVSGQEPASPASECRL